MKKNTILLILISLVLFSCSGNKANDTAAENNGVAKTEKKGESMDTASVRKNAKIMVEDMEVRCADGDIETLAALSQEVTDNISYSLANGDKQSARIYAEEIQKFIVAHADAIGDMASQNYVIKQLVMTIVNMPKEIKGNSTDSIMHRIASPISSSR